MMRRLDASYTIEAMLVMTIVLWTLASIIQYAYGVGGRTKAAMNLHESLERVRQETEEKKVSGSCEVDGWSLEIQIGSFRPEEFLRMSTLLEALEEGFGNGE